MSVFQILFLRIGFLRFGLNSNPYWRRVVEFDENIDFAGQWICGKRILIRLFILLVDLKNKVSKKTVSTAVSLVWFAQILVSNCMILVKVSFVRF